MSDAVLEAPIAIYDKSFQKWGCPNCGYRSVRLLMSYGNSALVNCGECPYTFIVMAWGEMVSSIAIGGVYPRWSPHPRVGILSHGRSDILPEEGGEFFYSRGIGSEWGVCFACGKGQSEGYKPLLNNIAAFVQCKEAGERVVAMFDRGARLDFREHEPDRVQVKVFACSEHLRKLQKLDDLCEDGRITKERIAEALSA